MIPHGVEVFVGLDPIDLRWSFDRRARDGFEQHQRPYGHRTDGDMMDTRRAHEKTPQWSGGLDGAGKGI